jgi:hypothetical protein
MLPVRIEGETRRLGAPQGREDSVHSLSIMDRDDIMISAWEPLPDEIEAIKNGAKIHLHVVGTGHPPVMLTVAET